MQKQTFEQIKEMKERIRRMEIDDYRRNGITMY